MTLAETQWSNVLRAVPDHKVELGRLVSNAYVHDPKMLGFICARYKFVAKMLSGRGTVVEIGCGDGFGAAIVAAEVDTLLAFDMDHETLRDNDRRKRHANIDYCYCDLRQDDLSELLRPVSAAYAIDVIEHVPKDEEGSFVRNIAKCLLLNGGTLMIGTPNATAHEHASELSRIGHVNLKTHDQLRALGQKYFHAVFMFGQNDEVVHTGFAPMCQYLWMMGVGPRVSSAL